jgi:hypothetical protein
MLLVFWLPILLRMFFLLKTQHIRLMVFFPLVSLLWAIHTGIQFTYQTFKTVFPKPLFSVN